MFGYAVSGVPDVDGDGRGDIIVGAYEARSGTSPDKAGRAYIFSCVSGVLLHTLISPNEELEGRFGIKVSGVPDVDGDGRGDVIVAASLEDPGSSPEDAGRAYIFSGSTGALLHTLISPNESYLGEFGFGVSGLGDVDNDGRGDVIVGAYKEDLNSDRLDAGRAYVFSGSSGSLLYDLASPEGQRQGYFGSTVSGVADLDDDGVGDIVVGAFGEGPEHEGRAYIFSGATGGILHRLRPPEVGTTGSFGISVSGIPDVDGDGRGDVIVGSRYGGSVHVFSGLTGNHLRTLREPNAAGGTWFGNAVSGLTDLDGDDKGDVAVGAPREDIEPDREEFEGGVYVFSGATGRLLEALTARDAAIKWFGFTVSQIPDMNRDGKDGLGVGVWARRVSDVESPSRAYVFEHTQLIPALDVVMTAHIDPSPPKTPDDLECVTTIEPGVNETDFNTPLSLSYRWFKDSALLFEEMELNGEVLGVTGPVLSHHFTAKDDGFICEARVTNGTASLEARSEPVTVANTLPTAPVVRILPENPTPDDGLAALVIQESEDADGDDLVYLFEWYESSDGVNWTRRPELSGNPQALQFGQPEISSLFTQIAEFWRIDITPVEIDSLPTIASSKASASAKRLNEIIAGAKGSYSVLILPDLNGDDQVNHDDLLSLLTVWHKRKGDLDLGTRRLFFEPGDLDTLRIGTKELFILGSRGWFQEN